MKMHLLSLVMWIVAVGSLKAQVYNPVLTYNYNGTPNYGVKIKTNLPFLNYSQMPTIIFEGFNFDDYTPIGITLVYYIYGGEFYAPKASSWGAYTPIIKLVNENEKVVIFIDDRGYFDRFTVRAYAQGLGEQSSWFQGWTVADEAIGGTNVVTIPYQNNFAGNVFLPGNSVWTESNVGIGTTGPSQLLSVGNSNQFTVSATGVITGTAVNTPSLTIPSYNTVLFQNYLLLYGSSGAKLLSDINGNLSIGDGATDVNVYVKNDGNVGIGTANPQAKLQVAGNLIVDGNLSAKYQDVAEWVPSAKEIQTGYVVITDPNLPRHVLPSSKAYDTRVAGVVSEAPGIILGESGEGKVKIATVGRVKVKVDASNNPVYIGDLLVSSDRQGYAMKSEPIEVVGGRKIHQPGTLIGKALEPLESGIGEVLVLLSLQ